MAIMTNAFDVGGVGANLVPQLNPNIGALANVAGSTMSYGSNIDDPITNEDGTITLPTIELQSNDPNLAPGELQKVYGIGGSVLTEEGVAPVVSTVSSVFNIKVTSAIVTARNAVSALSVFK